MAHNEINPYQEQHIRSWRAFDSFEATSANCVYRGQGNSNWPLVTGYERCKRCHNPLYEKEMLHRFISQAGVYETCIPNATDYVSWFALMQHYGAKTRLLDVTRSKYIALFFALEDMRSNNCCGAVWAIDMYGYNISLYNQLLHSVSDDCIDTRCVPLASALEEYKELGWRFANRYIVSDWEGRVSAQRADDMVEKHKENMVPFLESGGLLEIVPQVRNKRMIAQAAEFLMPITLRKSFMENLFCEAEGMQLFRPRVTKLIIHRECLNEMIKKLDEMNVTWQTVYPDLTGLAMSVN